MFDLFAGSLVTAIALHFCINMFFTLYALLVALVGSDLLWVVFGHKYFLQGEGILFIVSYLISLVIVYFKL